MSFSFTGLQLVNRVRRLRRLDAVSSIAATEDLAALDAINNAIEEVLSSERWEFDLRRDQMTLRPRLTSLTVSTDGSTPRNYNRLIVYRSGGLVDADTFGDYIVRIVPTGSTNFSSTAFRANTTSAITAGTVALFDGSAEITETMTDVTGSMIYTEYIMPDTVRDIVRVTYQNEPLTLEQIDPVIEFDELYPGSGIEYGPPETISVGGLDVRTYLNSVDADPAGLRMVVWPVPDQAYVLDYSYYYRHPELTSATSTLEGVPQNVVAKIVDVAAAHMKAYYEKDYNALGLKVDARRSLADMHRRSKGQSADRKVMGNWEGTGSRHRQGSLLGGRLINGGI